MKRKQEDQPSSSSNSNLKSHPTTRRKRDREQDQEPRDRRKPPRWKKEEPKEETRITTSSSSAHERTSKRRSTCALTRDNQDQNAEPARGSNAGLRSIATSLHARIKMNKQIDAGAESINVGGGRGQSKPLEVCQRRVGPKVQHPPRRMAVASQQQVKTSN